MPCVTQEHTARARRVAALMTQTIEEAPMFARLSVISCAPQRLAIDMEAPGNGISLRSRPPQVWGEDVHRFVSSWIAFLCFRARDGRR